MTIWILALLLLGGLAGIGYQQGAIRVAISFIGIIVAALLAGPLARFAELLVKALGAENPTLLWILPPFVVFVVVLSLFKVVGYTVHNKVDVFYRYRAGDLRLALWERLNARLGLCLGLLNGLAYLVLISMVLYQLSYWTVQMATGDVDPKGIKLVNRMGHDLQRTGLARVARAIDPMPGVFYDAADLAGLLYQNPLLEARLSRYPAFLSLSERPEFQAIAQDKGLTEARMGHAPIRVVLQNPNVWGIAKSPTMLNLIWETVSPNLDDLRGFLEKGQSAKYSEKILGRWYFDLNAAMSAYRRSKPTVTSSEMKKKRQWMTATYARAILVATTDHNLVVKNFPQVKVQPGAAPSIELQTVQGQWKGEGDEYELSLGIGGERKSTIEAGRLVIPFDDVTVIFRPEE